MHDPWALARRVNDDSFDVVAAEKRPQVHKVSCGGRGKLRRAHLRIGIGSVEEALNCKG